MSSSRRDRAAVLADLRAMWTGARSNIFDGVGTEAKEKVVDKLWDGMLLT